MKAKELLEKTQEDAREDESKLFSQADEHKPSSQEEKVEEAYENITRKIEALRHDDDGYEQQQQEQEQGQEEGEDETIPTYTVPDRLADPEFSKPEITDLNSKEEGIKEKGIEEDQTLDDLAREEEMISETPVREENQEDSFSIPNLHSPRPTLNFQYRERPVQPGKKPSRNFLWLAIVGLGVIAVAVYLLKNQSLSPKNPSPSPSAALVIPSPQPTPTPIPTLSPEQRGKYKVRVLNGTSKTGMAASVSARLKELGYQTGRAANATNSAFTKTLVRVKAENISLADQLIKDLLPDFDASASLDLKGSETVDGEIILGIR